MYTIIVHNLFYSLYYILGEKSMVKKFICVFISIFIFLSVLVTPTLAYKPSTFSITGEGCILASADTGAIIYDKNAETRFYPASLTKIMTAVVVLDECKNPESVMVTAQKNELDILLGTDSSVLGLVEGEQFSALELLYILLVHSANDAANVLAKHFGGSIEGFVQKMNQKAKQLGMTGSRYMNAHGLHDTGHYTTPKDMFLLTKHALKNETFKEIFGTIRHPLPATNKNPNKRLLATTVFIQDPNSMLPGSYYSAVKGGKTGYTDDAGRCLVSVAEKNGASYICVLMKCPVYNDAGQKVRYEFSETKALYEWVFNDFEYRQVYDSKTPVGECPVELGKDADFVTLVLQKPVNAVVPKNADQSTIDIEIDLNSSPATAPIKQGDVLGTATVKYAGEVLDTVSVVAMTSVEKSAMLAFVKGFTNFFGSKYMKVFLLCVGGIILVFILYIYLLNRRRKRRHRRRVRIK